MKALIIIDMLNDFATVSANGETGTDRIVPSVRRLLDHARTDPDWIVVYANAAQRAEDRVVAIRGRHAMAGTSGAQVLEDLAPVGAEREIVISKRFYGAFDGTELDDILFDYDVTDVVLAGRQTDCAVTQTAYGAFFAGYNIIVPTDAVSGADEPVALERLVTMYGADLTTSAVLIGRPVLRTATSGGLRPVL